MRSNNPTLLSRMHSYFFSNTPLDTETKRQIINNIAHSEESKNLDNRNKKLDIAFNIVQSAIGGVMLQFCRGYFENNDLQEEIELLQQDFQGHSSHILHKHTSTIYGIGICIAVSTMLNVLHTVIRRQDPQSYQHSSAIKNKIHNLTPKALIKAIDDLNNNDENALNILMPQKIDNNTKQIIAYTAGGSLALLSSAPENKQYLIYATSVAITKFALEQIDKHTNRTPNLTSFILSQCDSEEILKSEQLKNAQHSITGEQIATDFDEQEMADLRSQIIKEMQLQLTQKNTIKADIVDFFTHVAQSFSFFSTIHNRPGSAIIPNEFIASAIDFTIGSVCHNTLGELKKTLTTKDVAILPIDGNTADLESYESDSLAHDSLTVNISEIQPTIPEALPSSTPSSPRQTTTPIERSHSFP
ncbi:MAG: hypothetical protein ISQ34_05565 [Rickettsiales bacterium]|nr:hypothetical protein [Rickettsiales bacterium]